MPRRGAVRATLAAVALAVGVLAACSDADDGADRSSTTRPTSSTEGPTETTQPASAALVDAACARELKVSRGPEVADAEVLEASGVVVGRRQPGVSWVQNDSGGLPRLYGIHDDGSVQRVDVAGAEAFDWEDLAPAVGGDHAGLWIADTGDNATSRASVQLYRVDEPGPTDTSVAARRIEVRYPDGAHDVEAVLADPDGPVLLLTKSTEATSSIYAVDPVRGLADGEATATRLGSFEAPGKLALITGGDVAADRRAVVLRTYSGVWLYRLGDGQPVAEALAAEPCKGRTSPEVQGEAVGFAPDGRSYVTIGESGPTKQPSRVTTVSAEG